MASTSKYTERVMGAISVFRTKAEKPPFTEAEMLVMALLLSDKGLTGWEIVDWICTTFRFYQKLATACLLHMPFNGHRPVDLIDARDDLRDGVWLALQRFDIPLKVHPQGDDETTYGMSETDCHRFLAEYAGFEDPAGAFPFFALPPELRNTVYELVFQFPVSGVRISTSGVIVTVTRSMDQDYSFQEWRDALDKNEFVVGTSVGKALAPLRTNRQFYQEATPYFYQLNQFRFIDSQDMSNSLQKVHAERRKLIERISFQVVLPPTYGMGVSSSFHFLTQLEGLRKLHIEMEEQQWLVMANGSKLSKYQTVAGIPGFNFLRKLRGLTELTLTGCPTVEAMVREDMMKPRSKKRASSARDDSSKKRKVKHCKVEDAEDDGLRRSARIKKARVEEVDVYWEDAF